MTSKGLYQRVPWPETTCSSQRLGRASLAMATQKVAATIRGEGTHEVRRWAKTGAITSTAPRHEALCSGDLQVAATITGLERLTPRSAGQAGAFSVRRALVCFGEHDRSRLGRALGGA